MKDDLGLTSATEGFVVSILIFGAAIGALIGGRLSDKYGRRHNILMLAVIFALGTLGCVLSPELGGAGVLPVRPGSGRGRRLGDRAGLPRRGLAGRDAAAAWSPATR